MWLALALSADAAEPAWRWITSDHGLVSEHVDDITQGPDGFLWVATHAGVYRYDGVRAERIDGGDLATEVRRVVVDGRGVGYARAADGSAYRLHHGRAEPLSLRGAPARVVDLEIDARGEVWALADGARPIVDAHVAEDPGFSLPGRARVLRAGPGGVFLAGTFDGWYRVGPGLTPVLVAPAAIAVDADPDGSGGWWLAENGGAGGARIRRLYADGRVWTSEPFASRGMSITHRDGAGWAGFAGMLVRVDAQSLGVEVWGPERGVTSGGPTWVDHEGTLWLGTFRGLAALPDPDAALWDRRDGLLGDAQRFVVLGPGALWVSGWGGLAATPLTTPRFGEVPGLVVKNVVCADGDGAMWSVGTAGLDGPAYLVRYRDGGQDRWPLSGGSHFHDGCATASDGSVVLTSVDGLWQTRGGGRDPERVTPWPTPDLAYVTKSVDVAADGAVWVAGGHQACRWDGSWTCEALPPGLPANDVVITPSGDVWVAQPGAGILRRSSGWTPIPASTQLPSRFLLGLRRAERGGLWILGHAALLRVTERRDRDAGWDVEEELAPWLGHLVSGAADLTELPDGSLWIAHNGGLTHVPAGSRQPPTLAPPVHVLEVRAAGVLATEAPVQLADAQTAVSLRFAAASYRAPSLLRYRVRIDDGPWSASRSGGTVEIAAFEPGHHRVEVAASLDGAHWTDPPASVNLIVPLPWYGRWEVWAAIAGLGVAFTFALERVRAAVSLRMERLRTRIALDLHDQVGAGLGAIGLMAGLLGRPGIPMDAQAEAARRVAMTAEELSTAMRGIVWSLRPQSARLDHLGRYLEERSRSALPHLAAGRTLLLDLQPPRVALDIDVLRNVQLVALEAVHNVARHADAPWARVALEPAGRGQWRLIVEDAGRGLGEGASTREDGGNGLRSIRARAAEIRATLTIGPRLGGGTRIELTFRPHTPWWTSWRRA